MKKIFIDDRFFGMFECNIFIILKVTCYTFKKKPIHLQTWQINIWKKSFDQWIQKILPKKYMRIQDQTIF